MKKTIAKAWTQARDKNGPGGMPGMPPMWLWRHNSFPGTGIITSWILWRNDST